MDQRVVEIALQNLLSNALKYSPGDSRVELEIRSVEPAWIEFRVQDHGIGIPKKDIPHVVDSFYRGSNVGDVVGTGLGLALVKSCSDLHGGTLEIESDPGQGTCVTLRLPDWRQPSHEIPALEAEVIQA